MRIIRHSAGIFWIVLLCGPLFSQTTSLVAEKTLTIGPGAAGGPYVFVQIEDVKADSAGNIYVLDSVRARIAKFNSSGEFLSTIGQPLFDVISRDELYNKIYKNPDLMKTKLRSSRESNELYSPRAFYLDKQSIFITDLGKIVVCSATGEFQHVVSWKQMLSVQAAFLNAHGEVVLLGSAAGRNQMFHVLDKEGNIARSYGDNFEIPAKLAASISGDQKESKIRMMSMPVSFYLAVDGEVLVLSPFRYEIRIYRDDCLWKTIIGTSEYSGGIVGGIDHSIGGKQSGFSVGYVAPPVILRKDDLILVFQVNDPGASPASGSRGFRVDVFKDSEFIKSYDLMLEGYPKGLGPNGHLFTVGYGSNLFVNEYVLKSLPGL